MKILCLKNTGEALKDYEYKEISKKELGRFGATSETQFGLTIGKEYLVMGMILGENSLHYLIDDTVHISAYPYPLFEVIDHNLPSKWFFKTLNSADRNYPYQEAFWGYQELVFEQDHYKKLVENDEEAIQTYFKRKIELEEELNEDY